MKTSGFPWSAPGQGQHLTGAQGSPEDRVRLHGLRLANVGFHASSGDDFSQGAQTAAKLSSCIEETQDARVGPPTRVWAH